MSSRLLRASVLAVLTFVGRAAFGDPVMVPPKLHEAVEPEFPAEAQAQGLSATVGLVLDVDATGAVTAVAVKQPSGYEFFDQAAIAAAKKLVFDPATRDGKPIPARIPYRIAFTWKAPPVAEVPKKKKGVFRATVRVSGPDVPLAAAKVDLVGADGVVHSVATDANGVVEIAALDPGDYRVTIASDGFVSTSSDEKILEDKRIEVTYRLAPKPAAGGTDIVVLGKKPPREVTVHTLEQRELSRIPGTNGDALKAVQSLPGVGRSSGLSGALIVRGAAPQDTLVFLDGVPIPIIYHFGGLSSVVPTEMLEKLDFRPGNFSARYGRAMGGIVEVSRQAAGSPDGKVHALAQADFIDARFIARGPIPWLNGWSFVVGARRSYLDLWLAPLLSARGGISTAPRYYDWQAFVERKWESARFSIGLYGSDDALAIYRDTINTRNPASSGDIGLHTGFGRVQAAFDADLSKSIHFRNVAAYGWNVRSFQSGQTTIDVTERPFVERGELSIKLAKGYFLHVGADVLYTSSHSSLTVPESRGPGQPSAGASPLVSEDLERGWFYPAFYTELELQLTKRFRVVDSFRVDYSSNSRKLDASPRVSFRYDLVPGDDRLEGRECRGAICTPANRTTVKGGYGVFVQPPQPNETSDVFGTPGLLSNRSVHTSMGIEQTIGKRFELSVEGFHKSLDRVVVRLPASDGGSKYANIGLGRVIGAETLLRYKPDARFFGWIAYTLLRSERQDAPDAEVYLSRYDQTHILTILGSYRIGGGWELGARFRLVSGNVYTPCLGGAQDAVTGSYSCIPATTRNDERLPIYHQIDLRLDRHWYFAQWQLSAYLDLYNAYNRQNAEGISYSFDYSQKIYQTGLPLVPSLGVRGEF